MQTIELALLVKKHEIDRRELASAIFPTNKFPDAALDRILDNGAELSAPQIKVIHEKYNISLKEIFNL